MLGADGAGVSLARDDHHLAFVAASDGHVAAIEEQQIATGTGPCHDAFQTGDVVAVTDLATEDRWPEYTAAAQDAGAAAVLGVLMPADEGRIGALNVYRHTARKYSRHTQSRMHDVAAQVVDGTPTL